MGKTFGNLYHLRRLVYFRISPHEQKPFAGMIKDGLPNMGRRIEGSIFRVAPMFMVAYLIFHWANEENHQLHRKDHKLYENDK